jgi:glycosyltransferase involved in cell wall biosynthesis
MTPQADASSLAGLPSPRVTIITPVIGDAQHLEATLRSVIYQCYTNLEFIVIEDGASNERREILQKYRAHFLWQTCPPGTDLCAALNMAFAKASGEILGWLEPGDMLLTSGLHVIGGVFSALPDVA